MDSKNSAFIQPLMEARQRASTEQFTLLLEYMERNGDLARPQASAQGRLKADQLWQELIEILNAVGGGVQKPTEKWKKVWADWKTKTKKKAVTIRTGASGTGGGPSNRLRLTALEERVLSILGLSAVTGDEHIQEQGFEVHPVLETVEVLHHLQVSPPPPPPPSTRDNHTLDYVPAGVESPILRAPLVLNEPGPSRIVQDVRAIQNSSPPSAVPSQQSTPRRRRAVVQQRRRRALTPFDRAVTEFAAVEARRLRVEEERDRRLHERELERERMLHEREMQRLQVESQRVEVERTRNNLLQCLTDIPQLLMQLLQQFRQ